jgi:hypothetical protein
MVADTPTTCEERLMVCSYKEQVQRDENVIAADLVCPPFAHLNRFVPSGIHIRTSFLGDCGRECGSTLDIHRLELFQILPHFYSKACSDGRTESGGLAHSRPLYWDANKVCLCLHYVSGDWRDFKIEVY